MEDENFGAFIPDNKDDKNFERALNHISNYIKHYRETELTDGNTLNHCLQQISSTLAYLERERADFHHKFQKRVNELIIQGKTVSRAENTAHAEIPEMYLLRRVMDSAYTTCDAIRTNISWLKSGLTNA